MDRNYLISIALIVIGGVLGIVFFNKIPQSGNEQLQIELFKFSTFTVMVGGFILVFRHLSKLEEKNKKYLNEIQDFRDNFLKAYHDLKKVRRNLRTQATLIEKDKIVFANKNYLLDNVSILNDAHLGIENSRRFLEMEHPTNSRNWNIIRGNLKQIDDYTRSILDEFETNTLFEDRHAHLNKSKFLLEFLFDKTPPSYVNDFESMNKNLLEIYRKI